MWEKRNFQITESGRQKVRFDLLGLYHPGGRTNVFGPVRRGGDCAVAGFQEHFASSPQWYRFASAVGEPFSLEGFQRKTPSTVVVNVTVAPVEEIEDKGIVFALAAPSALGAVGPISARAHPLLEFD